MPSEQDKGHDGYTAQRLLNVGGIAGGWCGAVDGRAGQWTGEQGLCSDSLELKINYWV